MPASIGTLPTVFNHCNFSPWAISSWEFQDTPRPLAIDEVETTDRRLWEKLARLGDPSERGRVFHDYVSVKFGLHAWADAEGSARACLRHSYLHSLLHWGVDSNGPSGAALKAWVESRFGLRPLYHGGRLDTPESQARYAFDRMRGLARTCSLCMQLDLLYTFAQLEFARRHPGLRWLTLYRGTHDSDEYALRDGSQRDQHLLVELNNLTSFTSDREVAWEFGSSVWKVAVPVYKIVYFPGLLPPPLLEGEHEHLVLGGEYHVRPLRY